MKSMKYILKTAAAAMLAILASVSCTKDPSESFTDIENRSLRAWIDKNRPDLLENYQEEGAYYVEVFDAGAADSISISKVIEQSEADDELDGCWIFFNLTGRDLQGQVCLTRDAWTARMEGTFTKFTHYVPYMRFVGTENVSLMEGTYLAMKNKITLGRKYAADNGLPTELYVRYGTRLRLYLPSSLAGGTAGVSGDGGYEGQFSLDSNKPMIMELSVTGRINNPVAFEACVVDGFGTANGGISPLKESDEDDKNDDKAEEEDDDDEVDDGMAWRHACDTIPGLLVSKRYTPATRFDFSFDFTVDDEEEDHSAAKTMRNEIYSDSDPANIYNNFDALESQINDALLERFGEGVFDGSKIGGDGKAKIWYICRFLDGFIADTNISEIRELLYGPDEASDTELTYSPENNRSDYVPAWYYAIQNLRYGQWAAIVSTSTFAYGSAGRSGSTSTSSSGSTFSYMPYYNYYNYYNSYYGSSYYDMYYYNYYNNYLYNSYADPEVSTTTTTSTEVQSYTPLIFQIFIEPKEE